MSRAELTRPRILDEGFRLELTENGRYMLAFRSADCQFAGSLHAGGLLAAVDAGTCLVGQTTTWVRQLQLYQQTASLR